MTEKKEKNMGRVRREYGSAVAWKRDPEEAASRKKANRKVEALGEMNDRFLAYRAGRRRGKLYQLAREYEKRRMPETARRVRETARAI